jgi:hypothetical protein
MAPRQVRGLPIHHEKVYAYSVQCLLRKILQTLGYTYENEKDDNVALVLHERTDLGDLKKDSDDAVEFRGAEGTAGSTHSSISKFVHNAGGFLK